jgi:hypothetical protein
MSLIGIVNLTERLLNQTQDNGNEAGPNGKAAKPALPQNVISNGADEFRPSAENTAKEAGLFQVRQQQVFTAAATVLLVQEGAGQKPATAGPAARTAQAAAAAAPVAAPVAAPTATLAAAPAATNNADVLAQLQSLNSSLAALGLSQAEIDVIDRVAQLIKDFSPAAFTSLVNQLQILQQDTTQNTTANAAANTAPTNATGTNTQNGGAFTLQELSIKFAGVNETLQQNGNGKNANGGTVQLSAFQLQVSEVQITLSNPATGQTAQVQAPQTAAPQAATATA